MKTWVSILTVVAVVALAGADTAASATVKYDMDKEAGFAAWRAYAWRLPNPVDATISERRITRALEAEFAKKGYVLREIPLHADFTVTWRARTGRATTVTGTGWTPRFGGSAHVQSEETGTLTVEVHERKTGKLVWQGSVTDAIADDPDDKDETTAKAVAKLLRKFPARVAP